MPKVKSFLPLTSLLKNLGGSKGTRLLFFSNNSWCSFVQCRDISRVFQTACEFHHSTFYLIVMKMLCLIIMCIYVYIYSCKCHTAITCEYHQKTLLLCLNMHFYDTRKIFLMTMISPISFFFFFSKTLFIFMTYYGLIW